MSLYKLSGSAPRSSEGIYNAATAKAATLFSANKASAARLLSVPEVVTQSIAPVEISSTSDVSSFWRYLIIFIILSVLFLNVVLFLIKPMNEDISHLYDPLIAFLNKYFNISDSTTPDSKLPSGSVFTSAIGKLEKALNGNKQVAAPVEAPTEEPKKTEDPPKASKKPAKNKLPVIPEADDSTSSIQMKPTSKTGFCYIGEDRGFRSCIAVGEGDVCMSGDIFPTEAICVNPKLRE